MLSSTARKNERKYAYSHPVYGEKNEKKIVKRPYHIKKTQTNEKAKVGVLAVCLLMLLALVLPYVVISGNAKLTDNKIAQLNSEINTEQIKNSLMEREYMRRSSYSVINQKAIEAGMVEAQTRVNIPKHSMK